MVGDVHPRIVLDLLQLAITILLLSTEGYSTCVSKTRNRLCRKPCSASESCPEPSCSEECAYCQLGYYGPFCSRTCKGKSHCVNNNCILLQNGRALNCSEGCKPGWRGLSCNTNCKHPCLECNRFDGECVGRCREGYFGQGCYERCDENCLECKKESGKCTGGCVMGYYGENCSQPCSEVCEQCDKISGECMSRESLKSQEDPVTTGRNRFDSSVKDYPVTNEVPTFNSNSNITINPVYSKSDELSPADSSFSFVIIVAGVLVAVAILVLLVVSLLLCNTKHGKSSKSTCKQQSTDSCEPLTVLDSEHIYDEINDNPEQKTIHTITHGYITPICTPTTITVRGVAFDQDSTNCKDSGYLSPINTPTRSKRRLTHVTSEI